MRTKVLGFLNLLCGGRFWIFPFFLPGVWRCQIRKTSYSPPKKTFNKALTAIKNSVPDKVLTAPKNWPAMRTQVLGLLNLLCGCRFWFFRFFFLPGMWRCQIRKTSYSPPQKKLFNKALTAIQNSVPDKALTAKKQWEQKSLGSSTLSGAAASFLFFSCQGVWTHHIKMKFLEPQIQLYTLTTLRAVMRTKSFTSFDPCAMSCQGMWTCQVKNLIYMEIRLLQPPKKGRFLQAQKQFLGSLRWFFIKRHLLRGWKHVKKSGDQALTAQVVWDPTKTNALKMLKFGNASYMKQITSLSNTAESNFK